MAGQVLKGIEGAGIEGRGVELTKEDAAYLLRRKDLPSNVRMALSAGLGLNSNARHDLNTGLGM